MPDRNPVERLALSLSEAAEALGVSDRHLRTLRHELPVVRLGGRLVVPVDALRDWLRSRAETGSTDAVVEDVLSSLDNE